MGIVLAFAVGYCVGANAGQDGFADVVDSWVAVRDSSEFGALVGALRAHTSHALRALGERVGADGSDPLSTPAASVVDRVRDLIGRGHFTSPAS